MFQQCCVILFAKYKIYSYWSNSIMLQRSEQQLPLTYQTCWVHRVDAFLHFVVLLIIQFTAQDYYFSSFFLRNKSRLLGSRIKRYACCSRRDSMRISCFDYRGSDVIDTVIKRCLISLKMCISLALSVCLSSVYLSHSEVLRETFLN